jgi:hypothetical protein
LWFFFTRGNETHHTLIEPGREGVGLNVRDKTGAVFRPNEIFNRQRKSSQFKGSENCNRSAAIITE